MKKIFHQMINAYESNPNASLCELMKLMGFAYLDDSQVKKWLQVIMCKMFIVKK